MTAKNVSDESRASATQTQPGNRQSFFMKGLIGLVELFVIAVICMVLGAIGATRFALKDMLLRLDIPATQPALERRDSEAIGVMLFANGKSEIDAFARRNAAVWAKALAQCSDGKFVVTGSASSVPFEARFAKSNVDLARERAEALAEVLRSNGVKNVTVEDIPTDDGLNRARRLNDQLAGKRNLPVEAIARRADIRFEQLGSCKNTVDLK